jgi:circadian clock protein KaiC
MRKKVIKKKTISPEAIEKSKKETSTLIKTVAKKKKTEKRKYEKISTGVKNLDKLTDGGFVKSSINMITGGTGTGKSIFAIQFLIEGLRKGEACLYISFEEKKEEVYTNMSRLGWDLEKYENQEKFFFLEYTPEKVKTMLEEGGGEIETIVLTKNINRIGIDSITAFISLFTKEAEKRDSTLSLLDLLRKWTSTVLLTYEKDPSIEKKTSSMLEFEVDSIITLYSLRLKNKREKFLEVFKMRGTKHSTEIYPFSIEKGGIDLKCKSCKSLPSIE